MKSNIYGECGDCFTSDEDYGYGSLEIWSRVVTINNASDTTTEVIKNIEPFIFNLTCKNSIMIGMNDPMKYIQK